MNNVPEQRPDNTHTASSQAGGPPGSDAPGNPPEFDYSQPIPSWFVWVIRLAVAGIIVWGGFMVYEWLMANKPKRDRRPRGERIVTVETQMLKRVSRRITISTTGTVTPSRELSLLTRVGGEVMEVNAALEPGGRLSAGAVAVRIDPTDYQLDVSRARAALSTAENAVAAAEIQLRTSGSRLLQSQAQLAQVVAQAARSEADLIQAETQVITAEYNHAVERGKQDVAKHEWSLVDSQEDATELERELTLRKPHLRKALGDVQAAKAEVASAKATVDAARSTIEAAKAAVDIAKATIEADTIAVASAKSAVTSAELALEKANLDLARTDVKVPFDAVVLDRSVSVGAQVGTQSRLATLVAADAFWIEVALPLDKTPWIAMPSEGQPGAEAIVRHSGTLAKATQWQGRVIRRLPQLEANGRQVRLLVEVQDPLAATAGIPPLLLDAFVTVELSGPILEDVFVIPRVCIHNGNEVWLRNNEKRLDVRTVDTIWSDAESALVKGGLQEEEQLIVSDVASPVPGMRIALPGETPPTESPGKPAAPPASMPGTGGKPGQHGPTTAPPSPDAHKNG